MIPYKLEFSGWYTPREYYTLYWMTVEYLRLRFTYPDWSERSIELDYRYNSVYEGRVPVLWVNEWEPVVHIPFIIDVTADQSTFTDLQIEVIEALKAGITGDSPLERAIRISDRIAWEINKRLYLYRQDVYATWNDVILSETGLDGKIFTHTLPETYFAITQGSPARAHRGGYVHYWITVEYFRLRFINPVAGPSKLLELFRESVRAGRVNVTSIRPR